MYAEGEQNIKEYGKQCRKNISEEDKKKKERVRERILELIQNWSKLVQQCV